MESALITTPFDSSASRTANADLPLAVGPAISATGIVDGELLVFIATLIASESLAAGDISAAEDRVRSVGARPSGHGWLDEGVACDIHFDGDAPAVRAALEGVTLRQAVPRLTDEDLERAEKSLKAYEQALNDESDFDVWGELHWQFHSTLYAAANRTRSLSLIQTINNNADRYIRLHILFSRDAHRHSKDEHRAILELCRQRDAEAASQMLEQHISKAGHDKRVFIKQQREKD